MLKIYDTTDSKIKEIYEEADFNPHYVLAYVSTGDSAYSEPAGVRFTKTELSNQNYIRIKKYGDEIERIHFEGEPTAQNGKYILSHNGSNREIENNELLELPYIGYDDYYIENFIGSITITYITYTTDYAKKICDFYYGSTPTWMFLNVDPHPPTSHFEQGEVSGPRIKFCKEN